MSGYPSYRLDHFAHAEPFAISQVVHQPFFFFQRFQCQQVGAGQIADMHVIAHARSIRSWVICSINRNIFPLSKCHLQNERNQCDSG